MLERRLAGLEAMMTGDRGIKLSSPESIVKVEDIAVIDGPVRVIVDEIMNPRTGALSFRYGSELFMAFYRRGRSNEVNFKFPAASKSASPAT